MWQRRSCRRDDHDRTGRGIVDHDPPCRHDRHDHHSGTTTTTEQRPPATVTTIVVQLDLTALGYFNGTVDGIAGAETRAAIAKFQSDNGIEADGEFGPVTDSEMVPQLMADTAYVEDVQEKLQEPDLYTGPIDGDYGAGTTAAIKKLQADCDLEQTGEIDIATRICLYEA